MIYLLVAIFAFLIYADAHYLRRRDAKLFVEVFNYPRSFMGAFVLVFLAVLAFSTNRWETFAYFLLLFIPPLYILRRNQFSQSRKDDHKRLKSRKSLALIFASDAFGVVVMWLFGLIMIAIYLKAIKGFFPHHETQLTELMITAIFSLGFMFILIFKASGKFSKKGFSANIGLHRGGKSFWTIIVLPILLGLMFAGLSTKIILGRNSQPQTPLSEVINSTHSLGILFAFLMFAILVAPLMEEIIFRGYFYRVIDEFKGKSVAIIFVASTFALLHVSQYWGDWEAIAMVGLLGFGLTFLRAFSGTAIPSIIMHYTYNGGVTMIPVIVLLLSNPAYYKYQIFYSQYDVQTKEMLLLEAIEKEPDLADAYNELAWVYALEDKNLESALDLIEKALEFDPENFAYLDTKAEILSKSERNEEAQAIWDALEEQ